MKMRLLAIMICALSAAGWARDWHVVREEADKNLPPWIQYYNRLKGQPKLSPWQQDEPESLNVRLVGKWGRGPAARVTGKDSLVYLALGSEVAIFNAVDGHNPRIINEVQCRFVVDNVILKDTVLYAVLQGGVEVFNVANPRSVSRIRYLGISAVDMCIDDSMAYTIDADSFKAYRIVSPESLERLGACADSGSYLKADSGFAYVCGGTGLYVIDATSPGSPHQVSALSAGYQIGAVWVEGGYCYYTEINPSASLVVADVTDPHNPAELGRRSGSGGGDIYKSDFYVYLPWNPGYQIVDVSTPSSPTLISSLTLGGNQNSVWTRSPYSFGFLADGYEGLAVINLVDPVHPFLDTLLAGAHSAIDVCADGSLALAACDFAGMKVLGVSDPTRPTEVSSYDTVGNTSEALCVRARDSFAFLSMRGWVPTAFRVIDVSDPVNPTLLAFHSVQGYAGASVLRDSLVFVAEDYMFEIFSIANPRSPRLVGSCALAYNALGLFVNDTLAFVCNAAGVQVVSITNPANPVLVASLSQLLNSLGICLVDSVAFLASVDSLRIWNFADPLNPLPISSAPVKGVGTDVVVVNSKAYVGCLRMEVIDVSNPADPHSEGYYATPDWVRRVSYGEPYVYAACANGGVCIFDTTTATGIAECRPSDTRPSSFDVMPNPASSHLRIRKEVKQDAEYRIQFYDATGRIVLGVPVHLCAGRQSVSQPIDISALPDGCYFLRVTPSAENETRKVIKTTRR